ncbi:MEIOTIC F-BOX protein MOF-like [Lolium rigidum]|uniref:MEIOTIC F-BOX protein MOF-like n=1 Tax=Lolium rigidum TaxID=89674 RepID=UPI001F5D56A5|nr:MEIOTIC F-BOX protein MOF-like [Lolium rigidum]
MEPSGKRPVGADDRLSDLPDGLLHTIMSFLTAREAVQMGLLSRRWEGLWCSMPCINIDEQEFLPETEGWDTEDEDNCRARFEDFVSTLLLFHSAPTLDVFRFNVVLVQLSNRELVDRWLRRGIKRCPKVVEIRSFYHKLPHLGSSSSRLKRLHLTAVTLDGTFTQQLRSGCPVLDDLELKFCRFHNIAEIVSCTLKNLTIQHCRHDLHNTLIIKAPSLAYLQLVIDGNGSDRNWAGGVVVSDMPFLIKAIICLRNSYSNIPKVPCKLLFSLINVKYLELTGFDTLANLHVGSYTFPVFHNVRTLMLHGCDLSDNFEFLGCFLSNAPALEKLTLQCCMLPEGEVKIKTGGNPKSTSQEYQATPTFQCPSLKWTEIKYKEDGDVQKVFDLLLGVWRNLQKTTIVIKKA